jgi:hypothetical protein
MSRFDAYRYGFPIARRCDRLLVRAREVAEGLAKLPPLTTRYTCIALTRRLRRIIDEGVGYGLALERVSAAEVARAGSK